MIRTTIAAVLALWAAFPAAATEYVLPVSQDTAPYSFVPTLPRYNNATLYAFVAVAEDQSVHTFETYLRFPDLAGVIPPGEVVSSADLLVYYAFDFIGFGDTSTLPGELYCHEITGPWNQTTLTWNNRPPIAPTPADGVLGIMSFGLKVCDVTEIVNAWQQGGRPDNGLAVISPTPRVIGMHASEASVMPFLKPTLVVNTVPAPAPVPALSAPGVCALAALLAGCGAVATRLRARR